MLDENEHESLEWSTPAEALGKYLDKKVKLAPPQFIILNILSKYPQFSQLKQMLAQLAAQQKNFPTLQQSPLFFPQIVNLIQNT